MCEGTRCTHHVNPAVLAVEAEYDTWVYKTLPMYDPTANPGESVDDLEPAAQIVRVQGRMARDRSGGPSHDQPMILLKNDLGRLKSDADARRYLYCLECQHDTHACYGCKAKVTHMSQNKCLDCIERWHNRASRDLRESLL
jgi:hypothetical protein